MKSIVSIIGTTLVLFIGLVCFEYYLKSDVSVFSFFMGLLGFFLVLSPAWDRWIQIFDDWLSDEEKND
jgi:hypothetical protein